MKILHILRNMEDERARITMEGQRKLGHEVALVLLQDAVLGSYTSEKVWACADDAAARGGASAYPTVSYDDIVRLIFEHNKVISW